MTAFVGIDPGVNGALAVYRPGGTLELWDMPTYDDAGKQHTDPGALVLILTEIGPVTLVVVELAQAMPGNGAVSMFNYGRSAGRVDGVLAALERPTMYVRPRRWCADLGVGNDKDTHRHRAATLYPQHRELFARKRDDGRADAALIAWWAGHQ